MLLNSRGIPLRLADTQGVPLRVAPEQVRSALQPTPVVPRPRRLRSVVLGVAGILVGAIALLVVLAYFAAVLGTGGVVLAGVLALVPLSIVLAAVRWIDRWDPEPPAVVAVGFLWGAGVSVLAALLVDGHMQQAVMGAFNGAGPAYDFFQAAVQAPLVEELAKGTGVLLILLSARRHFDGPVDGLVYSSWVAGGFAFTENIQYFGLAIVDPERGVAAVSELFFVRGLMTPFAHVMFTACVGIALGLARRRTTRLGALRYFAAGLVGAVLLHALWNGSLFVITDFYLYYALVQFPLLLAAIGLAARLRAEERGLTFARLTDYAEAGWFHPSEVELLATRHGRRQLRRWAARGGVAEVAARYIHDATRLAFMRDRVLTGQEVAAAHAREAELLDRIVHTRRAMRGAAR